MSAHKHIDTICIVIVMFTLLLTGLFMNGEALGITVIANEDNSSEMFTENDKNATWDTSNATKIVLSDDGSTINGNGAYTNGNSIHIVYAGKYVISGELSNGKITIDADGDDKIWLMLDGVSIHCENDAAIRIEQAGKVFLTLKDGTINTLSSGSAYSTEAISAKVDGVIYSKDDLTINGGGSLNVTAEYQHGIVCNDDLVLTGGNINVTAVQDGFHANDSVRIKETDITISAGDDGITVSNDDETAYIYIESGNISIPSCYEGLEATQITIAGGKLDIFPVDDGINANGYGGSSAIYITGGEITIINKDGIDADGLDSNKDIFISGGKLLISVSNNSSSAIDYGSEYGGICEINGGTVLACGSSGMAEGFDSTSTQGFLMYNISAEAGTTVTVKDADGNKLLTETVPCSFSSVVVSTPDMSIGDVCTIEVGESETEMTIDNTSNSSGSGGRQPFGGNRFNGKDSDGQSGNTAMPWHGNSESSNMQPPGMPDGTEGSGTRPNFQQGGMNGNGAGKDNIPNQEDASQTTDADAPDSSESLLLIGTSAIVLLIGCAVAFFYKRKG